MRGTRWITRPFFEESSMSEANCETKKKNYEELRHLLGGKSYRSLEVAGYMRLVVEKLG
jgi:hypothetical protein